MKPLTRSLILAVVSIGTLITLSSCGGGSSSSGGSGNNPPSSGAPSIATAAILPGTLSGSRYSTALAATGGRAPYTWSISQACPTCLFVNGLALAPATGVLSGTVNFSGTAGFIAQVTDAGGLTASKAFYLTSYSPLSVPATSATTVAEYQTLYGLGPIFTGGVYPLTFAVSGGALPPGMRLDNASGLISGSAYGAGMYVSQITITDSYSPAEIATQQVTITVLTPALEVSNSLTGRVPLNKPFSGAVLARGGNLPYTYSISSGALPAGLTLDPNTGKVSGTPTQAGNPLFQVTVTDSSSPRQTASLNMAITVGAPLGRNDSIQTATPMNNNGITSGGGASISPYIAPPDKAPTPGDTDYYKLVSVSGSVVHIETDARNSLDPVLELLDENGQTLNTCRQPGDTSNTFNSICVNDDISTTNLNAALDIQVSGAPSTPTTFYAHVLDWRGSARPDMVYYVYVNGVVTPLAIQSSSLAPASRGKSYSQQLVAANANGAVTWTLTSGSLPPGLSLASNGAVTGSASTDGSSTFTIQASDSSTPPQTASSQFTIQVLEPIAITSSAVWPDACLNQPYTFAIQTSGGIPPFNWGFYSSKWVPINLDQSTGIFSGTSGITGTFTGTLDVGDATGYYVTQNVSVTVKSCP